MPSPVTHADVDEAIELLRAAAVQWRPAPVDVKLEDAVGRVLAGDVVAPLDLPPFDNAAMDGYALRHADALVSSSLPLQGVALAGRCGPSRLEPGHCIRITTGALLPQGADTVVIKEHCEPGDESVRVQELAQKGCNVRRAGEDYRRGRVALCGGKRLTAPDIGLLASLGLARVTVAAQPRIRVLSGGDELVPAGRPLALGQIHDSNGPALAALLRSIGANVVDRVRLDDDRATLRSALQAIDDADLVLSCGGVSAGEADHLPSLLAELGEVLLWKVRIKPGMPFLFARIGSRLHCGLPGNPVSALVTCLVLVRPLLDAMEGRRPDDESKLHARLTASLSRKHRRREYRRGHLSCDATGQLAVCEQGAQGSAMQHGLVQANSLIELDGDRQHWSAGEVVRVHRLPWA